MSSCLAGCVRLGEIAAFSTCLLLAIMIRAQLNKLLSFDAPYRQAHLPSPERNDERHGVFLSTYLDPQGDLTLPLDFRRRAHQFRPQNGHEDELK
jgi:hypothetical protein